MSKVLHTDNPAGDKITLYTANDDAKEAAYIVNEILKLQSKGRALNDIAVLYRTNSQSDIITQSLIAITNSVSYRQRSTILRPQGNQAGALLSATRVRLSR